MAKLLYAAITSLDGYTADENGNFDWAAPDAEVLAFVNDLERDIGTYLFGRRMYETMLYWETFAAEEDELPEMVDFASIWHAAAKVVYSNTLSQVDSANTRLERTFDPELVRAMKQRERRDLSVSGAHLARHAFAAGLVDELHLFVNPVTVGGGTRALPEGFACQLELVDVDNFASDVVHLHYRLGT